MNVFDRSVVNLGLAAPSASKIVMAVFLALAEITAAENDFHESRSAHARENAGAGLCSRAWADRDSWNHFLPP